MKILISKQIKEADRYTIENEPISSIDLMERASMHIADWFINNIDKGKSLLFLVGKGNNGGDGLAVARILYHVGYRCSIYLAFSEKDVSEGCLFNLKRLPVGIKKVSFPQNIDENVILVDALLGTGVSGALKEPLLSVIKRVNALPNQVISIDMPSGMISEFNNNKQDIIKADVTLTLQFPKLAMLFPEAGECCGKIEVLPIGLSEEYIQKSDTPYSYVTKSMIDSLALKRSKFAHKGVYGHSLLICGSLGMAGAAVLATGGALRSGCGLVTIHLPAEERFSIYANYPSAIISLDNKYCFSELPANLSKYNSIGIGCGVGQSSETCNAFKELLKNVSIPIVIDADALNILASNSELKQYIPYNSILTPHIGELRRLVGNWNNEEHKLQLIKHLAADISSIVVVKGSHTMICTPNGECYFNSTGNSGMAKGGSGDVLTGYITGLLARGYTPVNAAIYGVYMHGLAGDQAVDEFGMEAMNSKDIIDYLR